MPASRSDPHNPQRLEPNIALLAIHDLRGAVHAIQGFLSVLRSEQAGPLTTIQHDFVSSAFITARRIERLVGDLQVLEFESQTLSLIPANCNLLTIVQLCVRELEPSAVGFDVTVEIRSDSQGAWDLVADSVRLEQIAFNLIENAIHYSAPHSTVVIRLKESRSRLLLVVENDIADPAAIDLDRLFQPFQRGEQAVSFGRSGLGIGLTVVQTLASAHNGAVFGRLRGTTVSFVVNLPRRGPALDAPTVSG